MGNSTRVNILCFFYYFKDIQHIIFWGRFSGKNVCDHCGKAPKRTLEETSA